MLDRHRQYELILNATLIQLFIRNPQNDELKSLVDDIDTKRSSLESELKALSEDRGKERQINTDQRLEIIRWALGDWASSILLNATTI